MRSSLLVKRTSTKAERVFAERLKSARVVFSYKQLVGGREVDFVCGVYAIDIDGHDQDAAKNIMLVEHGFTPIHFNNNEVKTASIQFLYGIN